jgi:phosphoserine phosphatase RsbU/P
MMGLAGKLDEGSRRGVLADLARIEAASREPAPTTALVQEPQRNATVVDEVSVLALGFQNLVNRVGDQYEQLERLVAELRAALQAKTQLIAIQQELEIARKMQSSMLPKDTPQQDGVLIHAHMHAAKEVGGDFYDFFTLDDEHVAMAVGDVSGKGVPAAFFMAVSCTLLRALAQLERDPGACMKRLNDLLASNNEELMFVTVFYAVLNTRTGVLRYANGGHNPPYVLGAPGAAQPIRAIESLGNMALAVMEDMPYETGELHMQPGEGLFLFTDGVTEAQTPANELYGEQRLEALLSAHGGLDIGSLTQRVLEELQAFEGEGNQADDITTLTLRYSGMAVG